MLSTDKDVREGAERKHINGPSPQGSNDPPGSRTKRQTCIIAIIIIVIITTSRRQGEENPNKPQP